MNILITDPNYKHSLGIVRALGRSKDRVFKLFLLSKEKAPLAAYCRYAAKTLVIPDYEKNVDRLLRVVKEEGIDLIIPVGSVSYRFFSGIRSRLEPLTRIVIEDHEKILRAMDKDWTYRFAEAAGVRVPKTIRVASISELESLPLDFPLVIKARQEMGINVVEYARTRSELLEKFQGIVKRFNFAPEDYPLVQEYIDGIGCGFFALCRDGACGPVFMHKRIREMPPTGGYSVKAMSYRNDGLKAAAMKLIAALKWNGMIMVEFKETSNGEFVLMELNPKFWGSLDLALEAGVNFPLAMIEMSEGEKLQYREDYRVPLEYHWPLNGDLALIQFDRGLFRAALRDCLRRKVKSNLWPSDPLPNLVMAWRFAKRLGVILRSMLRGSAVPR